jgi:tetratricopeptide (TPR) repeat protein
MCTLEEGDAELAQGEVLAMLLIRGVTMLNSGRLAEAETLLREGILAPYEEGSLPAGELGDDIWVVAHAYLNVGTVRLKLGDYEEAQGLLEQARGFDDLPFATGFHFQVKNTRDFVDKKLSGE